MAAGGRDSSSTNVRSTGAGRTSAAPRRARRLASRDVIREAAAALFLAKGYQETSMEEVASAAHVSKQTIYTHFADKEALFADLVLGNVDRVDTFLAELTIANWHAEDLAAGLRQVARRYLRFVIRPEVLRLRRLVIAEAARFPDLAQSYYERVPLRIYAAWESLLVRLASQGQLHVKDPRAAAHHFVWLLLGEPFDRSMFYGPDDTPTTADLERMADAAVDVFLAAYGSSRSSPK